MAVIVASINVYYQHAITTPTVKWPRNNNTQAIVLTEGGEKFSVQCVFSTAKSWGKNASKNALNVTCVHM